MTWDVSIIICTVNRPQLLDRAIRSLLTQRNEKKLRYEVIVSDDSREGISREQVECLSRSSDVPVRYVFSGQRNIAEARNAGLQVARGKLVGFIDDDCAVIVTWLDEITSVFTAHNASVVVGPVHPDFEGGKAPVWDREARFFTRDKNVSTGTEVQGHAGGNLMLRRCCIDDPMNRFDPKFGRTGGEDYEFISRMRKLGRPSIWCATALATEYVSKQQASIGYRYLRLHNEGKNFVRVRVACSNRKITTASHLMVKGALGIAIFSTPYLVSRWSGGKIGNWGRLKFATSCGKLLWFVRREFYLENPVHQYRSGLTRRCSKN